MSVISEKLNKLLLTCTCVVLDDYLVHHDIEPAPLPTPSAESSFSQLANRAGYLRNVVATLSVRIGLAQLAGRTTTRAGQLGGGPYQNHTEGRKGAHPTTWTTRGCSVITTVLDDDLAYLPLSLRVQSVEVHIGLASSGSIHNYVRSRCQTRSLEPSETFNSDRAALDMFAPAAVVSAGVTSWEVDEATKYLATPNHPQPVTAAGNKRTRETSTMGPSTALAGYLRRWKSNNKRPKPESITHMYA
jgi:hypothetical protein